MTPTDLSVFFSFLVNQYLWKTVDTQSCRSDSAVSGSPQLPLQAGGWTPPPKSGSKKIGRVERKRERCGRRRKKRRRSWEEEDRGRKGGGEDVTNTDRKQLCCCGYRCSADNCIIIVCMFVVPLLLKSLLFPPLSLLDSSGLPVASSFFLSSTLRWKKLKKQKSRKTTTRSLLYSNGKNVNILRGRLAWRSPRGPPLSEDRAVPSEGWCCGFY